MVCRPLEFHGGLNQDSLAFITHQHRFYNEASPRATGIGTLFQWKLNSNEFSERSVYTRCDITARCRCAIDKWHQKLVPKKSRGLFTLGSIWHDIAVRHNDVLPETAPASILSHQLGNITHNSISKPLEVPLLISPGKLSVQLLCHEHRA